jgi:hypothetical protein
MAEDPTTIYHYCGVNGFLGIVRERELWLSHCRFMNDYAEHVGILRQAHEYLQGLTLHGSQGEFRRALQHLSALVQQSPYLACFSAEGDLLSQWRAYANDGAGFAIGFSRAAIKRLCDDREQATDCSLSLRQVSYDPSQASDMLRATIQRHLADPNVADWRKNTLVGLARAEIWALAAECKNRGFREEREWRIVMSPAITIDDKYGPVADRGVSDKRFRVSANGIVPYCVLQFPETAITEVRLGPKNYAREQETRETLRELLRASGYDVSKIEIEPSEATYR